MPEKPGFLEELKRRHVWRVAIAYAVTGWLLIQVATQVFPFFNIPNHGIRLVVLLIVAGFPIAVVLAWVYELTPEGIRRTEPADSPEAREEHETLYVGRKLNWVTTVVLAAAVLVLLGNQFIWHKGVRGAVPAEGGAGGQVAATKSIAVLPFENLSDDRKNDYFVAGMQDLILTKLADIGDLKVISRTSTAKYQSHPDDLKAIGHQLGVATILEGSVQKQGDQVLINVQLIDAKTDTHLWAESYTRTLDNIFGVEGEVAEKIASALNAKLSPALTASLASAPTTNQAAYDLFLRAEYQANRGNVNYDTASFKAAIPLYRQAIAKDPGFALAYARLSYSESSLAWFGGGGDDVKQLAGQARVDGERALQLAPDLAAARIAIGYVDYRSNGDYAGALKAFDAALELRPNDAVALAARGYVERRQGRFDDAIASLQQALVHDPRNSSLAYELGNSCMMASRFRDAETWFQRALALDPENFNARANLAFAVVAGDGDLDRALAVASGDSPVVELQRVSLLTYRRAYRDAVTLLEGIPDTPDNFSVGNSSPKDLRLADLYRLSGDSAKARGLYEEALP
ncbi:MAG: tetratricopeptide repeat protein, partial [Lysobacterales bacterium]